MQTIARLVEHRDTILREIEVAAKRRDAATVLNTIGKLETLATLIRQQEEIDRSLAALKEGTWTPSASTEAVEPVRGERDGTELSSKERGRRQRDGVASTHTVNDIRVK